MSREFGRLIVSARSAAWLTGLMVLASGCRSASGSKPAAPSPEPAVHAAAESPPAAAVAPPSKPAAPAAVTASSAVEIAVAEAVEPAPPPKLAPRRGDRFRVLILGDSMAATDFGKALEARLDRHRKVTCFRRGKSSTGLARPDFFDWMAEGTRRVARHDPDLVVVIIGGNDGQDLIPKDGGRRVVWKTKRWAPRYRQRIEAFARKLTQGGRRLLWLELPAMQRPHLEGKLQLIRRIQKETLAELGPEVIYLDTRDYFYEGTKLLSSARVKGYRRPQRLRQADGIHFSVPGSRYFANRVYPEVLRALELEP